MMRTPSNKDSFERERTIQMNGKMKNQGFYKKYVADEEEFTSPDDKFYD